MKVKKYTITIECEDELHKMEVNGLYLSKKFANTIFMWLFGLYEEQQAITEYKESK